MFLNMDKSKEEILRNYGGDVENCLESVFSNIDDEEASPFIQTSTFLRGVYSSQPKKLCLEG